MWALESVVGDAEPSLLVLKRQPKCCSARVFVATIEQDDFAGRLKVH